MPTTQPESQKLVEINKQILELKKKIQLSEGQRKALFEESESESKSNEEEVQKLKKEISQGLKSLYESKNIASKLKAQRKQLVPLIGPLTDKTFDEIQHLLDLQLIDKSKQLDLIRYNIKKKQAYLNRLSKEYQQLLSEKAKKQVAEKVDVPIKKTTCDLQNNIHAVVVQLREANHIQNRYRDIKTSLQEDSARFENKIKILREELQNQRNDISKLQQVLTAATRMRATSRAALQQEEKATAAQAAQRDKAAAEKRRLVAVRRQELERLERKLYQGGKRVADTASPERGDDEAEGDSERPPTPPPHIELLADAFEMLKQATGSTSAEEVLERFVSQKDTAERLVTLRKSSEIEKKKIEGKLEQLNNELEHYKYVEAKDGEKKSSEMDNLQKKIEEQRNLSESYRSSKKAKEDLLQHIFDGLQALQISINSAAPPQQDVVSTFQNIKTIVQEFIKKIEVVEPSHQVPLEEMDEKWLPTSYNSLVGRIPLPQANTPVPVASAGSEDEEEVPSRGYLKRQAQLVVDAKSRKKALRIPRK